MSVSGARRWTALSAGSGCGRHGSAPRHCMSRRRSLGPQQRLSSRLVRDKSRSLRVCVSTASRGRGRGGDTVVTLSGSGRGNLVLALAVPGEPAAPVGFHCGLWLVACGCLDPHGSGGRMFVVRQVVLGRGQGQGSPQSGWGGWATDTCATSIGDLVPRPSSIS